MRTSTTADESINMGSFPSQAQQQSAHPTAASGGDSLLAAPPPPYHHQPTAARAHPSHTLIKKLTRGRVLFLGLDGAGKSTIIAHLVRSLDDCATNVHSTSTTGEAAEEPRSPHEHPNPTKSCLTATYRLEGDCYLQVVDVPGRRDCRRRWYTTALDSLHYSLAGPGANAQPLPVVGIVFVVDASDRVRFPIVADELIRFQKLKEHHKTLRKTQFFLLLNKTDQVAISTLTPSSLAETDRQKQELQAAHRTAMRAARRELKKCLDHQLRVDQRRHPSDYQQPAHVAVPAAPSGSISHVGAILPPGGLLSGSKVSSAGSVRSLGTSGDIAAVRTTVLMTSILECCAHDRESIRAIHAWIKDEVKKVL